MLTVQEILDLFPGTQPQYVERFHSELQSAIAEFAIDDVLSFIAAVIKDSNKFTQLEEKFRYSAAELRKLYPKQFPDETLARLYEYKEQRIAIRVYSGRYGNGNEPRTDGWVYRGRGLLKITGKNNYFTCGKALGLDLLSKPEYLSTPTGAARSAAWMWKNKNEI